MKWAIIDWLFATVIIVGIICFFVGYVALGTRAFNDGAAAYDNGISDSANPYLHDVCASSEWLRGYQEAKTRKERGR